MTEAQKNIEEIEWTGNRNELREITRLQGAAGDNITIFKNDKTGYYYTTCIANHLLRMKEELVLHYAWCDINRRFKREPLKGEAALLIA